MQSSGATVRSRMPKRKREKTWLLATLGGLLAVITAIVIWQTHDLIVPWWGVALVAVPWAGSDVVLRMKQRTLGVERPCIDWWSVPHYFAGVLFGLIGVPLGFVVVIATVWEVIEICSHTREFTLNRVVDVVLAAAGWATAMVVCGGSFPLV
jgi:hypothetical protein